MSLQPRLNRSQVFLETGNESRSPSLSAAALTARPYNILVSYRTSSCSLFAGLQNICEPMQNRKASRATQNPPPEGHTATQKAFSRSRISIWMSPFLGTNRKEQHLLHVQGLQMNTRKCARKTGRRAAKPTRDWG